MSTCIFCNEKPAKYRGVCVGCYTHFRREKERGFTTDADLVRSGFLLPSHNVEALAAQADGRREAIARRQAEQQARRATA